MPALLRRTHRSLSASVNAAPGVPLDKRLGNPLSTHIGRLFKATLAIGAAAALAACGGGGEAPASTSSAAAASIGNTSTSSSTSQAATAPRATLQAAVRATSAGVDTSGLDALYRQIGAAMASPAACAGPSGLAAALSSKAHFEAAGVKLDGAAPVAAALCTWLADDKLWGATLDTPSATRCSQRDSAASCRINVDLLAADGSVHRLGRQLAVTQEAGTWKLLGQVDPLNITAFASAQRERRLDSGVTVDRYTRGLVLAIPAASGLACARVTQSDASGQRSTLAYFKAYGGLGATRLSLWRTGPGAADARSPIAASGDMYLADDSYLALPEGSSGDAIVNSLVRDGGSLRVSLYADAGCSTPWTSAGASEIDVGVDGIPPLAATQALQAWPQLTATAAGDLRRLGLNSLATATLNTGWNGVATGFRPELAMLCVDEDHCATGDAGRIGERSLARSASVTTLSLANRKQPVVPADFKLLSLTGRNAAGLVMLADFHTCASTAAGQPCPSGG